MYNNITKTFGWVDGTSFDYQNMADYKPGYIPPPYYICGRILSSNDSFGQWDLEQINVYTPWNIGPICKKSAYI